jgi:hypothetical protein
MPRGKFDVEAQQTGKLPKATTHQESMASGQPKVMRSECENKQDGSGEWKDAI